MPPSASVRDERVAQVVPLLRVRHLAGRRFDYEVPEGLAATVQVGSVVWVPFGSRVIRGVVVGLGGSVATDEVPLRPIEAAEELAVPHALLSLAESVARRYLAPLGACLRLVVSPTPGRTPRPESARRKTWVVRLPAAARCLVGSSAIMLTPKQHALLEAVSEEGTAAADACLRAGVGRGVLRALAEKGVVELRTAPASRVRVASRGDHFTQVSSGEPELRPAQAGIVEALLGAYERSGFNRRLVWGITGSGKTEIYLRLLARALEDGGGAILLVPEIALTPQMIARVTARFGDRVGILHSGLARGERVAEYRRIAAGEARVVVGARSAVFAPVSDLRLIVIDESHDASYKQEDQPRYDARTVAEMRMRAERGLLVEGTATPSVEGMVPAEECLRLTERAAGDRPVVEVVDMRRQGPGSLLAPISREALGEALRRREQAIVLLNRRGYAGRVHCEECGHVMMCRDCELALTYHARGRRLVCHHCGRGYDQPPSCPSCGHAPLTRAAPGTERLDQELRDLVPSEQVFRMDSDVLTSAKRLESVLGSFSDARPAVLVGTQMVAKGHDFPDVTLVLVADADTGLYVPDFRAAERTFQLVTQVAGRAGRAGRPGRVLVQTWNPDVPCIRMALEQDESGFYRSELLVRERLGYPPFADLIKLVTVASRGDRAQRAAQYLVERLAPHFSAKELHGPARLPALRGRDRWHLLISARDGERAREIVSRALAGLEAPYRRRGVDLLVDVDPQSFG